MIGYLMKDVDANLENTMKKYLKNDSSMTSTQTLKTLSNFI